MTRKDEAYNYIKNAIVSGQLKPGLPIRENDISEALQMSRTPIREALKDLEAEGVVTIYTSHGTFVSTLTAYDVEEIFELRSLLETWSLGRSINRFTDQELDELEKMMRDADKSGIWEDIHKADLCLHNMIVEKSGSKRLAAFFKNLNTQIERISVSSSTNPRRKLETYEEHMEIIEGIRSRDYKKCQASLKRHLKLVSEAAIEMAKMI
ncbi:MAG: GntR family transcriptional regulator [Oscillospiraceae bacterium]